MAAHLLGIVVSYLLPQGHEGGVPVSIQVRRDDTVLCYVPRIMERTKSLVAAMEAFEDAVEMANLEYDSLAFREVCQLLASTMSRGDKDAVRSASDNIHVQPNVITLTLK